MRRRASLLDRQAEDHRDRDLDHRDRDLDHRGRAIRPDRSGPHHLAVATARPDKCG
jgi:hypothetical protein